jgi:hypothetical protein
MSAKKTPKGILTAASWQTCAKCRKRIPRSALAKHSSENSDCDNLVHPFIYDGETHTLLVNATTSSSKSLK